LRIDVYLNLIGIFRTRSASGNAASSGFVFSGGRSLKPSHTVCEGDEITVVRPDGRKLTIEVVAVPEGRQVSRKDRGDYYRVIGGDP